MKSARIYLSMIDMLLDYLEIEKETLLDKESNNTVIAYYNLTKERIEDKLSEELSLMWWKLEFDLQQKAEQERGFPKQAYEYILPLLKLAKEDAIDITK